MKMSLFFLTILINQPSFAVDSAGCDDCEVKSKHNDNIMILADQVKSVSKPESSPKSMWSANSLSKTQCDSILKTIEEKKLDMAVVPEILSVIDVVKAECGVGNDPLIVVKDIIPFGFEDTDLYFSWNEEGKLIIKDNHKMKKTDFAFQYTKKDLVTSPIVFNDKQLKIISNLVPLDGKEVKLKDLEARGIISKWWESTKLNVLKILNAPETDVYLPMLAYHDRSTYSPEHIKELNEKAFGIGIGKTLVNENGNTEMVFAMTHLDSHNQVEVNVGYGWQKNYNISEYAKVGVGYATGVVSREDLYNRVPVPFIFPMVSGSIGKNLTLNGVYIPSLGGVNNGSVLFVFGKYTFEKQKD